MRDDPGLSFSVTDFLFYKVVVLSVVSDSELLLNPFETPSSNLLIRKISIVFYNKSLLFR